MKIYFTRHGQTEWNKIKKIQGWKNSNLSEKGREDAKKLAERLNNIGFDHIYTSDLERAVETARIIRRERSLPIIEMKELREINIPLWEGRTVDEIREDYPEDYKIYMNRPHLYRPEKGESFIDLFHRIEGAMGKIVENGGEDVLIVSHGVSLKVLLLLIKNLPLERLNELSVQPGCGLNICEFDGKKFKLILEGDISHME